MVLEAGTLDTITSWPLGDYETAKAMAWLPDGSGVAFGGDQGRLSVRAIRGGQDLIEPRQVVPAWISEVAVSPDGRLIAVLGGDGTVVLIDNATGEPIGKPLKAGLDVGRYGFVQFTDDGKAFEVFSEFKRAYRYPIDTTLLIARACRIAARQPTPAEWTAMHGSDPQRPTCGALAAAAMPPPPTDKLKSP